MKKKLILSYIISFTYIFAFSQNANVSYEVRVSSIFSSDGSSISGSSCWETSNEEYTANVRIDGPTVGTNFCLQDGGAGSSSTYGGGTVLRNSTDVATTLFTVVYDIFEDDTSPRCTFNSGDDCRAVGNYNIAFVNSYSPTAANTYTNFTDNQVYNAGSSQHRIRLDNSWRYSGTANAISPTCQQQSVGYSSGGIRSWSVFLTAGRTYRFGTCGAGIDTYIRIYSSNGYTNVANFDDNGPLCSGTAASGDYTPPSSGWYYIEVAQFSRNALSASGTLTYEDITPAPGNPAVFGNGTWNVYGYNGGNINLTGEYAGFYTESNLSYNSTNRWGTNGSPSDASGWQGCYVPIDNHVVVSKRTNFTCGIYQLDIPLHDDDIRVYVNGTLVFSHEPGCCDVHTNIWTGYLTASSTIEVRHLEGGGGSNQGLTLTTVTSALNGGSVNSGGATSVSICAGTDLGAFTNVTSPGGGTIGVTNGSPAAPVYQWEQSPNGSTGWVNVTGGSGANTVAYDPPAISTLTYYRRKVTDACGTVAYSNSIQVSITPPQSNDNCASAVALCRGYNSVSFNNICATGSGTGPGGTPYSADVWYSYNPPVTGSYTIATCGTAFDTYLEVLDGCAGTVLAYNDDNCGLQSSLTVTLNAGTTYFIRVAGYNSSFSNTGTGTLTVSPPTTGLSYGSNTWNIHTFNGYNLTTYAGIATNTTTSEFNLGAFGMGVTANPSVLAGYIGCNPGNDNWSISARRQGFPCATYNVNLIGHDDEYILNIDNNGDGTVDFSSTAGCCNIGLGTKWTGILNASSRVEIILKEGGGDAYIDIDFVVISSALSSGGTIGGAAVLTQCDGGNPALFTVSGITGGVGTLTYQWEEQVNCTGAWNPISGQTTLSYDPPVLNLPLTSMCYRLRTTDQCGTIVYSSTKTINIVPDPVSQTINANPVSGTSICVGSGVSATFSGGSGGTGTVADVYEFSTNGGTSWATYTPGTTITATAGMVGTNMIQIRTQRTATGTGCNNGAVNTAIWTVVPSLVLTPGGTNTSCNGGNNGTASVSASGGTGTYTYSWYSGGSGSSISSLVAGTYTVLVTSGPC
ncbi:MAG: SprB repeat-containing protein, partial [Bacteroidia bacterium]|nr:SprB repeat-containing protein [Bacteroidia bacterium]